MLDEDGSDCARDMFWCENGPCIMSSLRCNGRLDCPYDDSDELDCRKFFCVIKCSTCADDAALTLMLLHFNEN